MALPGWHVYFVADVRWLRECLETDWLSPRWPYHLSLIVFPRIIAATKNIPSSCNTKRNWLFVLLMSWKQGWSGSFLSRKTPYSPQKGSWSNQGSGIGKHAEKRRLVPRNASVATIYVVQYLEPSPGNELGVEISRAFSFMLLLRTAGSKSQLKSVFNSLLGFSMSTTINKFRDNFMFKRTWKQLHGAAPVSRSRITPSERG